MTTLTQKNLIRLADEDIKNGQIEKAIQNLEEAMTFGHSVEVVIKLSKLYRKNKEEDQAYALIKEEPDLFSDPKLFEEYCNVLQANHFLIEALQLSHLLNKKLGKIVEPVSESEQLSIMKKFKMTTEITQSTYQSLLKLDLPNYLNFSKSLLLDPTQNFAVRLALCEDLVRLGIEEKIKVWINGEQTCFIPAKTSLLEKTTIYQEVIAGIGDYFRNNPSQLPMMLGESNLILGSLYPRLSDYIKDTDSFTSNMISFWKNRNGRQDQALLEKIYQNLPK